MYHSLWRTVIPIYLRFASVFLVKRVSHDRFYEIAGRRRFCFGKLRNKLI